MGDPAPVSEPNELPAAAALTAALVGATAGIAWSIGTSGLPATSIGHFDFTGYRTAPTDADGWLMLVHPDDRAAAACARTLEGDGVDQVTSYRLLHRVGGYRWVEERITSPRTGVGAVTQRIGVILDIDDRIRLQNGLAESEERLRLATSAGNIGIWDVDIVTGTRRWSADLKRILGLPPDTVESESLLMSLICPEDRPIVREAHRTFFQHADSLCFRIRRLDDGEQRWIESTGRALLDAAGRPIRRVGTWQDITARKEAEAQLQKAAQQDALTGLANRDVFNATLARLTTASSAASAPLAVVLVDLDHFKMINDTLGHEVGDFVLRTIAERLDAVSGGSALVARLGGDEFAVLLRDVRSVAQLFRWAERIVASLSVPIPFNDTDILASASIGAATYPDQERNAAELLKCADLALYASKRSGRARFSLFEPGMKAAVRKRATALQHAREALSANTIVPYYQPKVSLRGERTVEGFEALLRWRNGGTLMPPATITEAFEDPLLAVQIGSRMLERVAADLRGWAASGLRFGSVAVNVAGAEFAQGDVAERWLATMQQYGIAPEHLQLEVTETVFLGERSGEVGRALDTLHRVGVKIALDDFGTGYASLTHLRAYPVDILKIDKTFVDDLDSDAGARAIVKGMIALAQGLQIRVVAEGVERREQEAVLAGEGCDLVQGHLVARPMPASRVPHFVKSCQSRSLAAESTIPLTLPRKRA